jgi:hypothetical protein
MAVYTVLESSGSTGVQRHSTVACVIVAGVNWSKMALFCGSNPINPFNPMFHTGAGICHTLKKCRKDKFQERLEGWDWMGLWD